MWRRTTFIGWLNLADISKMSKLIVRYFTQWITFPTKQFLFSCFYGMEIIVLASDQREVSWLSWSSIKRELAIRNASSASWEDDVQ